MTIRSMSGSFRIGLATMVGVAAILLAAVLLLPRLLDATALKQRLVEHAAQATGLQVLIAGELQLGLFPGLQLTANDVRFAAEGQSIAVVEQISLGIAWLPLLYKGVKVKRVSLNAPLLTLNRGADGSLGFPTVGLQGSSAPRLELSRLSVVNATVRYSDVHSGTRYSAHACNFEAEDFSLEPGAGAQTFGSSGFTAALGCAELRHADSRIGDFDLTMAGKNGSLMLDPVRMTLFGATGSASIHTDFNAAVAEHALSLHFPQFELGGVSGNTGSRQLAEGRMDFSASLTMQGSTLDSIRQSMSGRLSLSGQQLVIQGVDLDEVFARYESSQNFNLLDAGAFFFVGPLGLLVTKGYDFATVMQNTGASTRIAALVSDWTVTAGVAQAQDVALATAANRLALQGGLDFHQEQFQELVFALVDARGCAMVEQVITSSFQNPVIGKPGLLRSVAGPVISLLERGIRLVSDGECAAFYNGSLPAPP